MKSVAIIYVSLHGQTHKIAKHIKVYLDRLGIQSCLMNAEDSSAEEFDSDIDAVILGGPLYMGRYPSSLMEWIPRHKQFLQSHPLAFFSVSLNAADSRPSARQTDDELIETFNSKSGLRPQFVASFAGSLTYSEYNWFLRFMMKRKSAQAGGPTDTSRDYEFTDFQKVNAFTDAFFRNDQSSEYHIDNRLHLRQAPLAERPAVFPSPNRSTLSGQPSPTSR